MIYANRLHVKQTRKVSGNPYMAHLLGVAALVLEDGGSEDQCIAALLHDAIEDQGGDKTRQEIRKRFGERVVEIVNGCSDADHFPKPPWRERKEKFIHSLASASNEVVRVTAADKLDNVRSLLVFYPRFGSMIWRKFNGGRDGTFWYYAEVTKALQARSESQLVKALAKAVDDLQKLD